MTKIGRKTDLTAWVIQSAARGISTLFILFFLLMGIGSMTFKTLTLEGIIISLFALATLAGVVIAWFREGIGGIMLTILGLKIIVVFMLTMPPHDYGVTLVIGTPFLVSGILYLICWRRLKRPQITQDNALQDSSANP